MRMPVPGVWLIGVTLLISMPAVGGYPIAGVSPSQRPIGAPFLDEDRHDGQWYQQALQGVGQPYPFSLKFLEVQGNWHTPFNRPGMPGRYDVRGWYR